VHKLTDALAVLDLADAALDVEQFDQITGDLLPRVATLVGCDIVTLTHLDLSTGREAVSRWPMGPPDKVTLENYSRLGATHPLRPHLARASQAGIRKPHPVRISEVVGLRGWRESMLRREVMPNIDDQMAVPLARRDRVVIAMTLGRTSGPFTDRQAQKFGAVQRHLAHSVRKARRTGHHMFQLTPDPGWIPAVEAPGQSGANSQPARPVGISRREAEVVELVASGLTDAQVARQLGLSPATVSKHLSRIYGRLGLVNRAALVHHWHLYRRHP